MSKSFNFFKLFKGQNLQICFMNESSGDDLPENDQRDLIDKKSKEETNCNKTRSNNNMPCSFSVISFDPNDSCDSFLSQHLILQVHIYHLLK